MKNSAPTVGSDAWWKTQKKNSFHNILKLAMYVTIFFLIWGALAPVINTLPLFSWWKQQTRSLQNKNIKKNCVSLLSIAYFLHFKIYYDIMSATSNEESIIQTEAQGVLITSLIFNYADGLVPGGALTGKALCESIIPDWPPPPALLTEIKKCHSINPSSFATWQKWPQWPNPNQQEAWRMIMFVWGAAGFCGNSAENACTGNQTPGSGIPGDPNAWCKPLKGEHTQKPVNFSAGCGDSSVWTTAKSDSKWLGNFLWGGYQIPYNSPVVIGYMTGTGNLCDTGVQTGDGAMKILLGVTEGEGGEKGDIARGGWWGAIRAISSKEKNTTMNGILNFFWQGTTIELVGGSQNTPKKAKTNKTCNTSAKTSGITAGIGAGMGMMMMAPMAGPLAPFLVLGGLGLGAVVGMSAAGKAGCCTPIGAPPCCKNKSCPKAGKSTSSGAGCSIM